MPATTTTAVNLATFPFATRPDVARSHARAEGTCLHFRSDGAGVLYFTEDGKLRQRTFKRISPIHTHGDRRDYAAEIKKGGK